MNEALLSIVATLAKSAAAEAETWPERILAGFRAARRNGMVTDENVQFTGAVAGLMLLAEKLEDEDAQQVIEVEFKGLHALAAATAPGVTLDLGAMLAPVDELEDRGLELFGLRGLWEKSKSPETET